jgi:hypothetical protein
VALLTIILTVGCSRIHAGEELTLICPPGEMSCESDQRVILYPTLESVTFAWELKKRYTPSLCRLWMNEAVRSRIVPVGTRIRVEGIETKEDKDILRTRTFEDNKVWYIEPRFVQK